MHEVPGNSRGDDAGTRRTTAARWLLTDRDMFHGTHAPCVVVAAALALASLAGCEGEDFVRGEPSEELGRPATHPVIVRDAPVLSGIHTGETDQLGRPTTIPCATCHENRDEEHELPDAARSVAGPHAGLELAHGDLTCASCHHPEEWDRLRLANGTAVPMTEAMRLCAQCHGPQHRDYQRGSHGGMRGYWDLSAGPRERNHCVDCHQPHAPAYPQFEPVFPPRDRFLGQEGEPSHGGEHG